jgi:cytochrome c-type biogenesis protein CcsB
MAGFEGQALQIAMGLYVVALVGYVIGFATLSVRVQKAASALAWAGLVLQSAVLITRGFQAGRVPLVSMYEYLSAFAWMVVLSWLVFERWERETAEKWQAAGALALLLSACLLGYASSLAPDMKQVEPLMPVLRSNWLVIHVSMAVVGYGAAGLASALACLYFIRCRARGSDGWISDRLPTAAVLDRATYKSVRFAFPFLTLLNVTGAVWAYYAWGRYWGWDPKETWSLITWLVYVFYLHARYRGSWGAPKLNAVVLVGLATIMFTFLGVNQLAAFSESLHSYAPGG